jgi:hypothetical protein
MVPMKEKLLNHYLKLGPRRFVVGTVILLVILDLLNGLYLKLSWIKNGLAEKMVLTVIERMQFKPQDFDHATMLEMSGLVNQSFDFFLYVIAVNNLFFYFFYLRKKLWAQGYVLFYTLTAAIFSFLMIFDGNGMGAGWMIFNLLTIPLYWYLYMGVKLLKNETTLEPKKKGQ